MKSMMMRSPLKERWNYRSNLNVPSLSAVGTHASPIMETTDMSCPFTMKRRIRCFAFWVCFFSFSPFFSFVFTNWYVFGVLCYFSVTHSPFTHICSYSPSLPLPLPLPLSLSLSLSCYFELIDIQMEDWAISCD